MSTTPRVLGGRYELAELIGRGGMADVHLGRDTRLGRQVAIKMLRSDLARDANFLTRFRREAQSAAGLNHPSIVAIFDSGEDELIDPQGGRHTVPFIVMEYVDGQTLRQRLGEVHRLSPEEAIRTTEGVLDALAYSHRMGIVHRDIKPANVMITSTGTVKVMDFGIARAIADTAATMTQTHSVVGTAQYLSPEQAQGQPVDARSDLYSTGCLLFELLTGRTPFTGDSAVAIAYQHVGEAPQPPSVWNDAVGGDLDAVTLHALAKDRETRYQDAASFRADLENVRLGRPISAAALGSGAAVGAAATQTLPAAYGTAGTPTAVQPAVGRRPANTAGMPAVGHEVREDERRGGGGRVALVTLLVLAVLALAGWGALRWFEAQAPAVVQVAVPSLKGMNQEQAESALRQQKLQGKATKAANEAQPGTVFDQSPSAGVQVAQNSTVQFSVSTGPDSVAIPDVTGFNQADARKAIEDAGLSVSKVQEVNDPAQDKGKVVSTTPGARQTVAKSSGVVLNVATGKVEVPDLVGRDWAVAANKLDELRLTYKKEEVDSRDKPSGTVLEMSDVNKAVDFGTQIVVKVARTPTPQPTTATVTVTQPPPTATTSAPPTPPASPTTTR
ncbi:MAG TPA: Stk1 family PASTA domain-containing Ser/Thr kinase [Intrasporangium sp.]|uniref:Stk1 family PASTA domain-containing Ser/Thr kinase n=1 Tax=Intrasporangium sp. TaxID=1925024 RepID=UPI002D771B6D|nr:Stk1 family PASTA domain-containing Ser/Thr kinase [Intrasporangium sp.]HET7397041.1 Stk1 family PASTA domain-containing Ser/Thr kinase [Intrasporangium sp.]